MPTTPPTSASSASYASSAAGPAVPGEAAFTMLLAALTALTALSIDMSLPALPQLQREFHAGVGPVQLTLSLFLLGYGAGQLVCGPLSDRLGRRPVLLAGLVVFTLAGLVCAGSVSLTMLILARLVQGMGASVGPIIARAIVRDRYDSRHAAAVLSQITQVMILAPLLAPTVGGFLLVVRNWTAIFQVLTAAGLLLGLVCWRSLPETHLSRTVAAGQVRFVLEGFRTVLKHGPSLRHTLTVCFSYAGMFAYISGSPFVLIDGFHVPREHFGYYFAATAACLMLGATANRYLLRRFPPQELLRAGVALVFAAGLALIVSAWWAHAGLFGVLVPMMGYLFALGIVQPNATAAAMAPHGRLAGVSSSLIGGLQTVGGAIAGYCVGVFYDHTPRSLAVTVALLAALAALSLDRTAEPADAGGVETASTVVTREPEGVPLISGSTTEDR